MKELNEVKISTEKAESMYGDTTTSPVKEILFSGWNTKLEQLNFKIEELKKKLEQK